MRGFAVILRRELAAYFNSPMAYVVAIGFMLLNSSLYVLDLWAAGQVTMRGFFEWVSWSACFIIPAITMRLWAEEKRGATYELLLTFPMPSLSLVAGKFLAALLFYAFCLSGSLFIPLILWNLSTPGLGPEWGAIAAAYLGALLAGALLIALGLFLSGLCRDQIEAFIVTLVAVLLLRLSGFTPIAAQLDGVLPGVGTFLAEFVSYSAPLSRFARGLVDLGDVLYFVAWTCVLLFLNALGLEGRLRPGSRARHAAAVALGLPLAVLLGSLVVGRGPRLDLTADRIYTVSPAAAEVLASVPEDKPVRVKLYFSPKDEMPAGWTTLERDVVEKLEELQRSAKGRLKVEVVHLHADDAILRAIQEARAETLGTDEGEAKDGAKGEVEEKLLQEGVVPFRVQTGGLTGSETKVVYAALSLTYGAAKKETIPQLAPGATASLEQELVTRVYRLVNERKPVVGLLAPIQSVDIPPQQMQLLMQLGIPVNQIAQEQDDYRYARAVLAQAQQYEVRRLRPGTAEPIPDDLSTLVVIQPQQLAPRMAWEIARFLRRGGSVVVAAQSFETGLQPTAQGAAVSIQKVEHGLGPLLEPCGVSLPSAMVMSDPSFPVSYSMGFMGQAVTVDFHWTFRLDASSLDRSTSITNGVADEFMIVENATPVVVDEAKTKALGLEVTRVLKAPAKSWTREVPEFGVPADLNDVRPSTEPVLLGALLRGQFPEPPAERPAWPSQGGEPPEGEAPPTPVEAKPGSLLVVGMANPFHDTQIVSRGGAFSWSGALLKNAVDALSLGDVLLRLTLREPAPRPMKPLERGSVVLYQLLIVGLAPLAYLVLGVVRLALRRRKQETPMPRTATGGAS